MKIHKEENIEVSNHHIVRYTSCSTEQGLPYPVSWEQDYWIRNRIVGVGQPGEADCLVLAHRAGDLKQTIAMAGIIRQMNAKVSR